MHAVHAVDVALRAADELGESPVWRGATGELLRVDILRGAVHAWDPDTRDATSLSFDGEVGAVVPCRDGGLVVAVERALLRVAPDGARTVVAEVEPAATDNRFNDCRCDPRGRLWAGTMSRRRERGAAALYRLDAARGLEPMVPGTTLSNGIGWSPSGESMYFIDSTEQRIDVFDFDVEAGVPSARRPLASIASDDGMPDGLVVDAEGGVWVALFGGGAVRRYAADGVLDAVVELPVPHPTCPAFGGPDLATLYVTTTRHRLSPARLAELPDAGAVFACEPGVRGLAATELADLDPGA
jgi:sugar lactone lactonase YvrE